MVLVQVYIFAFVVIVLYQIVIFCFTKDLLSVCPSFTYNAFYSISHSAKFIITILGIDTQLTSYIFFYKNLAYILFSNIHCRYIDNNWKIIIKKKTKDVLYLNYCRFCIKKESILVKLTITCLFCSITKCNNCI